MDTTPDSLENQNNTILFLDIDGALNNSITEVEFNPFNMANLKRLCESIRPKIVLSSDWRRYPTKISQARAEIGAIWPLFDFTPIKLSLRHRKDEIAMWLSQNEWDRALIIDDMDSFECDPNIENVFFHQTDFTLGLTEDDVDSILEKLNEHARKYGANARNCQSDQAAEQL